MTYHFPKKILGSRISLTYKRLMKILGKSYEVSKIGPQNNNRCLSLHMHAGVQSVRMLSPLHVIATVPAALSRLARTDRMSPGFRHCTPAKPLPPHRVTR